MLVSCSNEELTFHQLQSTEKQKYMQVKFTYIFSSYILQKKSKIQQKIKAIWLITFYHALT